ncbi:TetR/AcrR family transcriptional regulator [Kribbella sp. VKM Ac-2566]|uniref:TetR/AcrR family transcriptional regulator n=1 Tax=Kribbella sp. VKM Ac-2566 TaxID=2512218 RepID=UPI001063FB45|nr:TetR/AcrR family transcriptional regulator [Kribbella sp. VKM Ac-2566]TDX02913.1 TetR family transcriptional regulator [Kribbella sp. VKM Ac-2566]
MRADAERKRAQVVAAAGDELVDLAVAARDGEPVRLSLDRVAARARVGVATLYRHFPTREALLEAVYRQELTRLCDAAPELAADSPADEALLTWMHRYLDFVDSKRAMGLDLRNLIASGTVTQTDTRARLAAAVEHFLTAGAAAGIFRTDVPADDVVAAMAGAVIAAAPEQQRTQTERLHALLVDGLRRR